MIETHHSAPSAQRGRDVQASFGVECQTLRTAQAAIVGFYFTGRRNSIHRIEARSGWAGDVQVTVVSESKMVRGDGRLQRGENVNLARLADLKHRAAAIADVQVLFGIKGDAGGHSHPFHVDR